MRTRWRRPRNCQYLWISSLDHERSTVRRAIWNTLPGGSCTTAWRVDEVTSAEIAHPGHRQGPPGRAGGGQGNRRAKVVLPPATGAALHGGLRRPGRLAAATLAAAGHRHRRPAAPVAPVGVGAAGRESGGLECWAAQRLV